MKNKKYVSVSARIPEEVFHAMVDVRDKLEYTTNQMVTHCIQDWIEIAKQDEPSLTHRLNVVRFSLQNYNKSTKKF